MDFCLSKPQTVSLISLLFANRPVFLNQYITTQDKCHMSLKNVVLPAFPTAKLFMCYLLDANNLIISDFCTDHINRRLRVMVTDGRLA